MLVVFLCSWLFFAGQFLHTAEGVDRAFGEQRIIQQEAVRSQQRIDALDDQTRELLEEYRTLQAEADNLEKYNAQMRRMVAVQDSEIVDLETQARDVEQTRKRILPLMVEMVTALERFVAADSPFLVQERRLRLKSLRQLLDDPDSDLATKYQRILEAYRIEADYASSIEAYTGELALNGEQRTVDYLRLGRVGLYWLSLDHTQAGLWDARNDQWKVLDGAYTKAIEHAIRVARKQAPPELLRLPILAIESMP